MKTLGKKSLSAILAAAINMIWWVEWIAFIVLLGAGIITGFVRKGFVANIPITFSDITIRQVHPLNKDLPMGILNTNSGTLYLHADANWQNVALLLLGLTLVFAVLVTVTYQLKVIFSNFKRDLPFNETNISRIRNIAALLIGYSVAQWLFNIVVNQILIANLKWEHMELTYHFNLGSFGTGIILIVVAGIFRLGTQLEEENKLTI